MKRNMTIFLVGMSHKSAPVDVREKMGIGVESLEKFLKGLKTHPDIDECLVLSTCNRVEIVGLSADTASAVKTSIQYLGSFHGRNPADMRDYFYTKEGKEAVRHVFRVSSSLDSMVVGESQILGQVKDSYRAATSSEASGTVLNRLLHRAFFTAKRVKNETDIASRPVSISSAAFWLCEETLGGVSGRHILMIGAGEMAEEALKNLACTQPGRIMIANRTRKRAERLCERFVAELIPFEKLDQAITDADIVIASTGSNRPVITAAMMEDVMSNRAGKPIALIDIAVPRDVEEDAGDISGVNLFNIDDLNTVVKKNRNERETDARLSEKIIDEETKKFMGWFNSLDVVPTIVLLRRKMKRIGDEEIKKTVISWDGITTDEVKRVSYLVDSIINKILHDPTVCLKKGLRHPSESVRDMVWELFGLDGEDTYNQDRDEG